MAEMRNPSRDLPRVVNFSIPIVMACFILTNVSYYIILPRNVLQGSDAIAVVGSFYPVYIWFTIAKIHSRR